MQVGESTARRQAGARGGGVGEGVVGSLPGHRSCSCQPRGPATASKGTRSSLGGRSWVGPSPPRARARGMHACGICTSPRARRLTLMTYMWGSGATRTALPGSGSTCGSTTCACGHVGGGRAARSCNSSSSSSSGAGGGGDGDSCHHGRHQIGVVASGLPAEQQVCGGPMSLARRPGDPASRPPCANAPPPLPPCPAHAHPPVNAVGKHTPASVQIAAGRPL